MCGSHSLRVLPAITSLYSSGAYFPFYLLQKTAEPIAARGEFSSNPSGDSAMTVRAATSIIHELAESKLGWVAVGKVYPRGVDKKLEFYIDLNKFTVEEKDVAAFTRELAENRKQAGGI